MALGEDILGTTLRCISCDANFLHLQKVGGVLGKTIGFAPLSIGNPKHQLTVAARIFEMWQKRSDGQCFCRMLLPRKDAFITVKGTKVSGKRAKTRAGAHRDAMHRIAAERAKRHAVTQGKTVRFTKGNERCVKVNAMLLSSSSNERQLQQICGIFRRPHAARVEEPEEPLQILRPNNSRTQAVRREPSD